MQRLGFSLADISELLGGARRRPFRTADDLVARADAKIADIDRRIGELTAIRQVLAQAREAGCADLLDCDGNPACPLPLPTPLGDRQAVT
jgi:DNA-binding transcriptional MerR regulator